MLYNIIRIAALLMADLAILATSEKEELTSNMFRTYGKIKFVGGLITSVAADDRSYCLLNCANRNSCQAFIYHHESCFEVDLSTATELRFNDELDNYQIRRTVLMQSVNLDPESMAMVHIVNLKKKLVLGNMIYLKAIMLTSDDVYLLIYDSPDKKNITYQFHIDKCFKATCEYRTVWVINKFNGNFNTSFYESENRDLQVNKVFEVHVLITTSGIQTYLNGAHLYNIHGRFSPLTANYLSLDGSIKILEFSL